MQLERHYILSTPLPKLLIALCASVLTWGCGAEQEASLGMMSTNQAAPLCRVDEDCSGDLVCQAGACGVGSSQPARVFDITFTPANTSLYPAQRIQNLQALPEERLDFVLESSVSVTGNLLTKTNEAFAVEQATLIFERQDTNAESLLRPQVDVVDGTFAVDLLPGKYNITCIFSDEALPKRVWRNRTIGAAKTDLQLILPAEDTLKEVRYSVTHRDPSSERSKSALVFPVVGAKVLATSPSGQTSTVGVTDESGNVTIRIWADQEERYNVQIGPNGPNALMPSIQYEGLLDPTKADGEPVGLSMGTWSESQVAVDLSFLSRLSELDIDLDEARIVFESVLEQGQFVLSRSLDKRAQALNVMALQYNVTIYPQSASQKAPLRFQWDATAPDAIYSFAKALDDGKFPKKQHVKLHFLDHEGADVTDADVALRPVSDVKSSRKNEVNQSTQLLEVGNEGYVEAWLEPDKVYEVHVTPESSGQPQGVYLLRSPEVSSEGPKEQFMTLATPLVLFGAVLDSNLDGQANLLLELEDTFGSTKRTIAKTRTDSEGTFRAVVPASPYNAKVLELMESKTPSMKNSK